MSETLEAIKKLLNECSEDERRAVKRHLRTLTPHPIERQWDIDADTILSAINRASDLTKRGVRGIIAEAIFVSELVPPVRSLGWQEVEVQGEDRPYDALLTKGDLRARIQVKLQRSEKGVPKLYYPRRFDPGSLYVVEVQKTRTGIRTIRTAIAGTGTELSRTTVTAKTRPYSFGDFDILAVSMRPSSGDWRTFRYTLGAWLLPRPKDKSLIEIFQPVAATPNHVWTDDLGTCLQWLEAGDKRQILRDLR